MHGIQKRTIYILRSEADRLRHYVGLTNDVSAPWSGTSTVHRGLKSGCAMRESPPKAELKRKSPPPQSILWMLLSENVHSGF